MPNLVTIIFAILVAPSKSLDAPKMHNKRRLMPYYKWPKYTVNIIRQVLEYFTVCIAVLSSSQFSTKTISYKEKYYLIKRKSTYLLSGYQSVKILWNYTNSFFALQTLLLKLFLNVIILKYGWSILFLTTFLVLKWHPRAKQIKFSYSRTSGDVVISKDELLCHSTAHTDVHLSQQLGSCLTPTVILWEHGHLEDRDKDNSD